MRIIPGHKNAYMQWLQADKTRMHSTQVDFGVWWSERGDFKHPYWRVTWIEDTGELIAVSNENDPRFGILGEYPTRREVEYAMRGWDDSSAGRIYMNLPELCAALGCQVETITHRN